MHGRLGPARASSHELKEESMSTYIGIDWSQDKHDVAFMNGAGAIIARLTIPHQPADFQSWKRRDSGWV